MWVFTKHERDGELRFTLYDTVHGYKYTMENMYPREYHLYIDGVGKWSTNVDLIPAAYDHEEALGFWKYLADGLGDKEQAKWDALIAYDEMVANVDIYED